MSNDRVSDSGNRVDADNLSGDALEARIRGRIRDRTQARNGLFVHIVVFLALNVMLWGIWATAGHGFPWPVFITFSWGIWLAASAWQVYQDSPAAAARQEEEVQREVAEEKSRLGRRG